MSGQISKAESWSTVYKAYQNINFSAYDYDSIKRSLIEYMKTYHPENFNDYIENSEIIALIELFAYVGQLLAYRQDMNVHENFIQVSQRKQSILQLAKFISYNANRNLPPRGLVKINSVQTTDYVVDSKGNNLANKQIIWNDINNTNWREQFFLVMNQLLEQEYGTVAPADRVQVDDVVFELYALRNRPTRNGVLSYSVTSSGQSYPMELVPVSLSSDGPYERRPAQNAPLSILYATDGLGDSSDTSGFFFFTKQGTLNKITRQYDGITPNMSTQIGVTNINDTDVWVNNIDPDTGDTIESAVVDPLGRRLSPSGHWVQVDTANVENVIYNTNINRNKFEIETLENDDVRVIFGDGEFADIPSGTFDIWYRTSTAGDNIILQNSVINKAGSLSYLNDQQKLHTISFTFSLTQSLTNGSTSEDVERIRQFAPSVFYTQDRMVNGRDYNSYPLKDQSIVKLRTVNRTFAGDSRYLAWHDPSDHYEDVKIFGDDLTLMYRPGYHESSPAVNIAPIAFVNNVLVPLLSLVDVHMAHTLMGIPVPLRNFTPTELGSLDVNMNGTILGEIQKGLSTGQMYFNLYLRYEPVYDNTTTPSRYTWVTYNNDDVDELEPATIDTATFIIRYIQPTATWVINYRAADLVSLSPTTKFWFNNGTEKTVVQETLNAQLDKIILLKANVDAEGKLLKSNYDIGVIGNVYGTSFNDAGTQNPNALKLITFDGNQDGVPDDMALSEIFEYSVNIGTVTNNMVYQLPATMKGRIAGSNAFRISINNIPFHAASGEAGTPVQTTIMSELLFPNSLYQFVELNAAGDPALPGVEYVDQIRFVFNTTHETSPGAVRYNEFVSRGNFNARITMVSHAFTVGQPDNNGGTVWTPISTTDLDAIEATWVANRMQDVAILQDSNNTTSVQNQAEDRLYDETFGGSYRRYRGQNNMNFAWFHRTPRYHIVDPSVTNIHDMFVITRGYYTEFNRWVYGQTSIKPTPPTPAELRTTFRSVLNSGMMSDAVVLHPGRFKILFGPKAQSALRAVFKVVQAQNSVMTVNELKVRIVETVRTFFDIKQWEFGETFYFQELAAAIQARLPADIDSVILVPLKADGMFGDLFEIVPEEDELFVPDITVHDIEMIDHINQKHINS